MGKPRGRTPLPPEERFWAKVDKTETCWLWMGGRNNGYGYFRLGGTGGPRAYAHRFAYEQLIGPVPDGLQLDHLCRVRHCVNPAHLEPVTSRENCLRGESLQAANAQKTHCPKGHLYDAANTWITAEGWRACRTCQNARNLRSYYLRKQQV